MADIEKSLTAICHKDRPNSLVYIRDIFPDFIELKGDRLFGNDMAILGGIATFAGKSVTIIAQVRGRNLEENIRFNFSMAHPEGYRKVLRLIEEAEKFQRPIVCFVDTVGAYPGKDSEDRGIGSAISNLLTKMMCIRIPVVSILIGNGGSGGALPLCVADRIAALENATLSVISPKACASILWKNSSQYLKAAKILRMTAQDLLDMEFIDTIIPEPGDGAHCNPSLVSEYIRQYITTNIFKMEKIPKSILVWRRRKKFHHIGQRYE